MTRCMDHSDMRGKIDIPGESNGLERRGLGCVCVEPGIREQVVASAMVDVQMSVHHIINIPRAKVGLGECAY